MPPREPLRGQFLAHFFSNVHQRLHILSTALDGNHITLYADDMLLFRVINNTQDFNNVQQGINNIGQWVDENDLRLNSTKCKVMLITRRRTKGIQMPTLQLYGQPLERVFEYK